ncbi:hypothetical protein BCR33DRAFT_785894 [Rhizoclosmatium globosum]|uniref:NYN domain-containing protein n=1 Tax=Rhizoclosmatium globosum TaxID=329046 RepID=A0A1Y2C7Z8_9FUNG|nr:hypothetical protein BCR33DRAFT_785894 [Rhizoclosmatium globosum]|eukprot:ORY43017.1 hypothetical protein BCR33DRAFT_785894 [Rhizoclosmatium globosum]
MVDEKVHPIALIPPFQSTVLVDFHNNNFPNEAELLNTISACCYVAHYYGSVIEAVACNTSTLSAAKLNALKAYQVVILPQGVKKAASVETVLVDYCFSLIKPREPGRCFVICTNQVQAAPVLRTIAEHGRTVILITWDAELMTKTIKYLDPQNPQVFKLDDIMRDNGLKTRFPLATMLGISGLVESPRLFVTSSSCTFHVPIFPPPLQPRLLTDPDSGNKILDGSAQDENDQNCGANYVARPANRDDVY